MKQWLRLIGAFVFVIVISIALFSFAMFQGGFVSWFLFYSFLPIGLYQLGLLLYPVSQWKISREMPASFLRKGASVSITIHIERKLPFPLYYCICEELIPDTLKKTDNGSGTYNSNSLEHQEADHRFKKVFFLGFRRVIDIPYSISQVPRGEHQLTHIRIRTGDLFGFIKKEHIFYVTDQLDVYPSLRKVQWTGQARVSEGGASAVVNKHVQQANGIRGVREYVPGDRIAWIDWKQTARKNAIMTKEFEQETREETLIILDCCLHPKVNEAAFEAAVELANSLIEKLQKDSVPAHLLSIGGKTVHLSVQQTAGRKKIDMHLMKVQQAGMEAFPIKLSKEMNKLEGFVILITTSVDESLTNAVRQLKWKTGKALILFIRSSSLISASDRKILLQLEMEGINMQVLTEEELMKDPIEVRIE